jgi:hypothetical protein
MGSQRHASAALPPEKRRGTHCTRKWVSPGPVWKSAERFPPPVRIRSPGRAAFTITTELSRPTRITWSWHHCFFLTRLIVKQLVRPISYLITALTEYTFLMRHTELELKFSCVSHLDLRHCNKCNTCSTSGQTYEQKRCSEKSVILVLEMMLEDTCPVSIQKQCCRYVQCSSDSECFSK